MLKKATKLVDGPKENPKEEVVVEDSPKKEVVLEIVHHEEDSKA